MDINYDLFYEDENHNAKINALRIRRKIRDDSNPLDIPDENVLLYFRLNKEAFCYLLDEIKDYLKTPVRVAAVPPILNLCAALRFFADGSYQKCSGNDFNIGVAQPTMSLILKEVLDVIEQHISMSEMDKNKNKSLKLSFCSNFQTSAGIKLLQIIH